MAGIPVTKDALDAKSGEAVLSIRRAFAQVKNIATFLANNPGSGETDPLVVQYGYSEDDAYLMRLVFENFDNLRLANEDMFDTARKLTGLE